MRYWFRDNSGSGCGNNVGACSGQIYALAKPDRMLVLVQNRHNASHDFQIIENVVFVTHRQ